MKPFIHTTPFPQHSFPFSPLSYRACAPTELVDACQAAAARRHRVSGLNFHFLFFSLFLFLFFCFFVLLFQPRSYAGRLNFGVLGHKGSMASRRAPGAGHFSKMFTFLRELLLFLWRTALFFAFFFLKLWSSMFEENVLCGADPSNYGGDLAY